MLRYLLLGGFAVLLLSGCNNQEAENQNIDIDTIQMETEEIAKIEISEFENYASENAGGVVKVEGIVNHVCHHSMNKMYIMDEKSEYSLKLEISDVYTEFDTLMEGKKILAEGVVFELVIDSLYLAEWETELNTESKKESGIEEEGMHAESEHASNKEHEHHGDPKEQLENYKKQIEFNNGEALRFYSLKVSNLEVVE